ncbi:hypothetical protein [Arthrobacter cryoconiti]|uniref:Capsid maturation protease n=1 Tax=Arthrobacter cryoconiti TaxID=748907 RepID=A0ABV8QZ02_9MICC|nr:hypothetical protein [Arthrobacter cryoconiti]MCC9068805.1 hypothetical protein [Arthrobacter cryoconiti]
MTDIVSESAGVSRTGPGRVLLKLITPGVGSSGTYSAEVLAQAAKDKVWPRGTQSHINHDTEYERMERPEGNLRNLVGVLTEDAYVDADGALVAEVRVGSAWRDFVEEFHDFIGASVAASAVIKDTKSGRIVEKLIASPFNRVDLVTVAGRGGNVAEILEAATAIESRSVVRETTASDIDGYLRSAVRDMHRTEDRYAWMQDYDSEYVYFEQLGKIWRQKYTLNGVEAILVGDPELVHRRVEYDPVTPAAESAPKNSSPIPAEVKEKAKSKETTNMAEIKIEETRLATLEESHGRVPALEAKLTATESENVSLKTDLAKAKAANRAREFATTIVTAANADLSESVVARIVAQSTVDIPLTEALQLDTDTLTATVTAARESEETYLAKLAKENGLGQVRGIGATESAAPVITEADILNARKGGK